MKYAYSTGLGAVRNTGPVLDEIVVSLKGAVGTITIDETGGTATAEVTAPTRVAAIDDGHPNGAGWFERSLAALRSRPVPLAPPVVTAGTPGQALAFVPGTWLAAEVPANLAIRFTLEVDRGSGYAPVEGYEDKEYGSVSPPTIDEEDRGARFRLSETATGATTGTETTTSTGVAIPEIVALPTLALPPINQDQDLASDGVATETVAGAFAAPGRYLVGLVDLNQGGPADLVLEGAAVTSAVSLGRTTGGGNTHLRLFLVDAASAGDLTVRNTGTIVSYARQILIFAAEGVTDEGVLFAAATGTTGADPLTLGFTDVPDGQAVLAIGACRAGNGTDATWGGALSAANEISDAAFSSTSHRAASALGAVAAGDVAVSVAFDDDGGAGTAFAMVAFLFSASAASGNPHPGFLVEATDDAVAQAAGLTLPLGWGKGDHLTYEVDPVHKNAMVLEPGETTTRWYIADASAGGLTQADLESAAYANQTFADAFAVYQWLNSAANRNDLTKMAGLRSDRRVSDDLWYWIMHENTRYQAGKSVWFDLHSSASIPFFHGTSGESPLHPVVIGTLDPSADPAELRGQDSDPVGSRRAYRPGEASEGTAYMALVNMKMPHDRGAKISFNGPRPEHDIILIDMDVSGAANPLNTDNGGGTMYRVTYYATNFTDVWFDAPGNGTTWDGDRGSGTHTANIVGKLEWRCFYDHNGWNPTYDGTTKDWAGGANGMPPNSQSHNTYDSEYSTDMTFLEMVSFRPSGSVIQGRGGIYANVLIYGDGNQGLFCANPPTNLFYTVTSGPGFDTGVSENDTGETIVGQTSGGTVTILKQDYGYSLNTAVQILSPDFGAGDIPLEAGETIVGQTSGTVATLTRVEYWGNYTLADRVVGTSVGYRPSQNGAGNLNKILNGVPKDATYRNTIFANGADPNDPADQIEKGYDDNTLHKLETDVGMAVDGVNNHRFGHQLYNVGAASNNFGLDGLTLSTLNAATIGGYVDALTSVSLGTYTTDGAIDHLHDNLRRPGLLASDIWNYFADLFGRPRIGHAPGATAVFTPNPDQDGFRMDGIGNWSVNGVADYPVDGDNCDLNGNLAFSFLTFRFADLNFGAGGGLRLYGGLTSCTTSQGTGAVVLRNAAKFRVGAGAQAAAYQVTATGGRYEVDGTVASGVSVDLSGQAQGIVYGGGDLTIAAGESLILTGEQIKVGFDGQGGQTARLTLAGQLTIVAGPTALPKIRKVRSGRFGFEDLGGGVTGQPKAPDVASEVVLGGDLTVNVSGLGAGSFTLIEADTLSGAFDSWNVTGGSGTVAVDLPGGRVTIAID